MEVVLNNGFEPEVVAVPAGRKIAEYLTKEYESVKDKLAIKDGYKFEGWYLDADFNVELESDALASNDITKVYAKWGEAGNVRFEFGTYTFVRDNANGYWKSNNQGQKSTKAEIYIYITSGVAEISFTYWKSAENSDRLKISSYDKTEKQERTLYTSDRPITDEAVFNYTLTYVEGKELALIIKFEKDSSVDSNGDTGYFKDLVINGIPVYNLVPLNLKAVGTYTATDGTVVEIGAGGGVKVGEEFVSYDSVSENVIGVFLAAGYREIELDKANGTCEIKIPKVKLGYNYNGHGGEDAVNEVAKYSEQIVVTPEATGYKFRGWYKDAAFTESEKVEAGSTIVVDKDTILYAKWSEAVTLKFVYDDEQTVAPDFVVPDMYVGDNVSGIPTVSADVKFGDKMFAGWFLKNDDGTFGAEASTDIVLEGDLTFYAKWVNGAKAAGTYKGWNLDKEKTNTSGSTSDTVWTVSVSGEYTGKFTVKGTLSDADASVTDGAIALNDRYAYFNAEIGMVVFGYKANVSSIGVDIYVGFRDYESISAIKYTSKKYNTVYAVWMTITYKDNSEKNVLIYDSKIYADVTFKDYDGTVVKLADLTNKDNIVVYKGETVVKEFAKNASGTIVDNLDGFQGEYLNENEEVLFFNGAGVAKWGEKKGTYALQADSENIFDVFFNNKAEYYEVELVVDGESRIFTSAQPEVTVTYNYMGHGAGESENVVKKQTYKVTKVPTAEGFKFWGWFEDEALTKAAKSSYSLTDNLNLYAKWTAAVTLTFDYNGQGTEAVVVADKYVGDKVSGIPAVAADVKFGEKVFAGWFVKHDDGSFGEEASTSTVLDGDTTYYAKWIDSAKAYGEYKGFEIYSNWAKEMTSFSAMITVKVDGTYTGKMSGKLSAEDCLVENGPLASAAKYTYFNSEFDVVVFSFGSGHPWNDDVYIGFRNYGDINQVDFSALKHDGKLISWITINYKNSPAKNLLIFDEKIYVDVTWTDNVKANKVKAMGTAVVVYDRSGDPIFKKVGTEIMLGDGLGGTFTGDYGEIVTDGYGGLTIGSVKAEYEVIDKTAKKIKFVAANAMRVVALGDGVYSKVSDGYAGEYTLPDGETKITLDGFGGAGDGKTYVVNGSNVTIFDGESSTTYGIDVANKQFLGKSVFAGYTFSGKYSDSYNDYGDSTLIIEFDDSSAITGTMTIKGYSTDVCGFTAVLDGSTIKFTLSSSNSTLNGKVFTGTLTGNKIKITDINGIGNPAFTAIKGAEVTCADFAG